MNFSSLTQIGLVIIAVAIIVTYINPAFADIKETQDTVYAYQDTLNKASEFNQKLNALMAQYQSFRPSDLDALDTYLPDAIDELQVMADLKAIADMSGITVTSLKAEDTEEAPQNVAYDDPAMQQAPQLTSRDFSIILSGPYRSLKQFLATIERNHYPLEVIALDFGTKVDTAASTQRDANVEEDGYTMTVRTYAYSPYDSAAGDVTNQ